MIFFQRCFNATRTAVTCPIPRIPLPPDFENYLNDTASQGRSPVTESGNGTLTIIGPNGRDQATVYIGAIFDGDRSYENFTSALPSVQIKFYPPPIINASNDIIDFNPRIHSFIEVFVSVASFFFRLDIVPKCVVN